MNRVIGRIMPVPLATGIVAAIIVIVGLDLYGLGRVAKGEESSTAKAVAQAWFAKNDNLVLKGVQSNLVGTGTWVGSLVPGREAVEKVVPGGTPDELAVLFDLNDERVTGKLAVTVNMRTSFIADVGAHVTSVRLFSVGPRSQGPSTASEVIYSNAGLARGRIGYFLYVVASVVWHFVVAGILYGIVALMGLGPKTSIGVSFLLSVVIVAVVSSFDPAWLAGSAALISVGLAWFFSGFIRHKRHLEVLRIITG